MGSGFTYAENKSGAHVQRAGVLRSGYQSGLQGVLQLLFGRQHSRVGLAQSDVGETIPRAHGRSVVHRHLFGRFKTVDRRPGQHRPLLGPERGPTVAATRFLVTDILARLLSDRRMVGSRHGELQRRSVARPQTGQIPTASARVVRAFVTLCDVW